MSMKQEAARRELESARFRATVRRYAGLLHDEMQRRYPRQERIDRYRSEIDRFKAMGAYTPEMP